jgi:hypothetical protein
MERDREAFRHTYGDYFVAGTKRAAQFIAVYHMRTAKKKELDRVKSQLGVKADVPEVDINGTADFNAKFEQTVKQNKIEYDIDVYMDGYKGAYQMENPSKGWTTKEVYRALNWFRANEDGKPYMAKLLHYSQIAPGYRRTVNIDPEVFAELNRLYAHVWQVRALDKGLPPVATEKWRREIDNFIRDVTTNQGSLATDLRLRNELTGKGNELVSNLGKASARKAFFDEIMSCRQSEPSTGSSAGGRKQPWEYGYTPDDVYWAQVVRGANGALDIKSEKRELDVVYEFFRHGLGKRQEGALEINDPTNTKLIVGWTVISNWGDDPNGSWWKETNGPILLGTRGAVRVRGEETRGTHWTVIYYVVNNADYPFQVRAR